MRLLAIVCFVATATAWPENCRGIAFNHRFYEPETVKEGLKGIQKLILNRNDNTLYFIFDNLATIPNKALGYINLDTKATGLVSIRNASAVAVDQVNNVVYAGGPDGLYIVNSKKVPERLPVFHNINDMFFKEILYFTNNRRETFKVIDNVVFRLRELEGVEVDKLILDDDNNILFTVDRRLYRIRLNTRAVNTHERYNVDAISVDAYFKPYIATTNGVFVYNKYKYALDKVSDIKDLSALTFNKMDEAIYGVVDVVIKLNLSNNACYNFMNLK